MVDTLQSGDPVVISLPNDLKLALRSQQEVGCAEYIIKEIFRSGAYVRPGFELSSTDTVVDIGGNIGVFSLWAAPQVARVISVEPTAAIDCLENSLALNKIENVSIVRQAVSDRSGTIEMLQYPGFNAVTHLATFTPSFWGQRLIKLFYRKETEAPQRITCPCAPLEEILDAQNADQVDFLKVDCEGGEYAVFNSISDSTLARISRIGMEYHELNSGMDHRQIVQRLKSSGFDVTVKRTLLDRLVRTGMIWAKRTV